MVAGATNKEHWFFFFLLQCKPQGGGSSWGEKNTTGIGRKLAHALYFYKCFKNNIWVVSLLYPHLSFFLAPPTSPGRQLSPQPSGILVLMTHVPIYIKPLELSISAGRFLLRTRGWALSQRTGRGRPLWGEPGIALTQGLRLAGSDRSDFSSFVTLNRGHPDSRQATLGIYNNPLGEVRTVTCIANQSLPNSAWKGEV